MTITTFISPSLSSLITAEASSSLSLVAVLVLLALLIQKELTTAAQTHRLQRLGQMLNIAIAPLLIAFSLIAIARLIEALQ